MKITAVTPQKRKRTHVNIFVDDTFSFSLDLETLVKHGLRAGQTITQTDIDRLISEKEFTHWYHRVLNLFSLRPRSRFEILDFLKRKEVGATTSQKIIQKLEAQKLLDDREFSRWFVEQRKTFRPKGKRFLEMELRKKGIGSDIVRQVLESEVSKEDELAHAYRVVLKKRPVLQTLTLHKRRQKIAQLLFSRGFSWDTIEAVWQRIKKEFPN